MDISQRSTSMLRDNICVLYVLYKLPYNRFKIQNNVKLVLVRNIAGHVTLNSNQSIILQEYSQLNIYYYGCIIGPVVKFWECCLLCVYGTTDKSYTIIRLKFYYAYIKGKTSPCNTSGSSGCRIRRWFSLFWYKIFLKWCLFNDCLSRIIWCIAFCVIDAFNLLSVPDLPIGSIGWSLEPQHLGVLRPRYTISLTLLMDILLCCHNVQ